MSLGGRRRVKNAGRAPRVGCAHPANVGIPSLLLAAAIHAPRGSLRLQRRQSFASVFRSACRARFRAVCPTSASCAAAACESCHFPFRDAAILRVPRRRSIPGAGSPSSAPQIRLPCRVRAAADDGASCASGPAGPCSSACRMTTPPNAARCRCARGPRRRTLRRAGCPGRKPPPIPGGTACRWRTNPSSRSRSLRSPRRGSER